MTGKEYFEQYFNTVYNKDFIIYKDKIIEYLSSHNDEVIVDKKNFGIFEIISQRTICPV